MANGTGGTTMRGRRETVHLSDQWGVCRLLRWHVQPGGEVARYDILATVETDGIQQEVVASATGRLAHQHALQGEVLAPGSALCTLVLSRPAPSASASGAKAPFSTQPPSPGPKRVQNGPERPTTARLPATRPPSARRTTLGATAPPVAELTMPPHRPPAASPVEQGPTRHQTYHLTPGQCRRVKSLARSLRAGPALAGMSHSELVRAALEHLLRLPPAEQQAVLAANRERERSGGYGYGARR